MAREKHRFTNQDGLELDALLERPAGPIRGYALFAHCFTCSKNVLAASRICRGLAREGFAALRFDFTGLGNSDGDFANTNFSSNVQDLVAAANYMEAELEAPVLLVGHSLGGTAMLAAAESIPDARAVVTIGAPAGPDHVIEHLEGNLETIREHGEAEIDLGGRRFRIKRQFLEDIEQQRLKPAIAALGRPLLIFHSPVDTVVSVDEAAEIYAAAKHPKGFLSLDQADHLLGDARDAAYVADTIAAWVSRYLPQDEDKRPEVTRGEVTVTELDRRFLRAVYTDKHAWLADEPEKAGGGDQGPDPYEHLLAALGTCTSMTLRMYANHKEWPLDHVTVTLRHDRDYGKDCEDCEEGLQRIERRIEISGDLDTDQHERLLEIADRCPVHRTLSGPLKITTEET